LTLVLPKNHRVPDIVTAGLPTVAVRMPDHPLALAVIQEAGVPLAAPSANAFGRISPTTADHVRGHLGGRVDMVLDGGPCRLGVESTIISLTGETPTLLRVGGLPAEEIERAIGGSLLQAPAKDHPDAPGQLPHHYCPQTPLVLRANTDQPPSEMRSGLLSFRSPVCREGFAVVEVLSPAGDLREAAANLFAALHRLDAMKLDVIVADRVPDTGLGPAINDRLRRAAHGGGAGLRPT
jgi:L-threonylcarbamoyladenylate synthase